MKEEEKDDGIKISMPLISNLELQQIDNNMDNIVEQFTKAFIHDKELAIAQHIIENQKAEIEKYKKENHNLKEKLQMFIPRRRVRRVYKMIGKILRTDISPELLEKELKKELAEEEK